jgi:hypothetical protein
LPPGTPHDLREPCLADALLENGLGLDPARLARLRDLLLE